MSELTCLELSVVLWLVHVLVQASFGNAQLPSGYMLGSRDKPPKRAEFCTVGRAGHWEITSRTSRRSSAVALALIATQRTGGAGAIGATIWILARIVYLPIYVFGIIYLRTAIWAISIIGLIVMLRRLAL